MNDQRRLNLLAIQTRTSELRKDLEAILAQELEYQCSDKPNDCWDDTDDAALTQRALDIMDEASAHLLAATDLICDAQA